MKKLLLFILILFFSTQYSFAQTPHFRNYTVDDGLPSSHIYRAFQDSKGFIWLCTDKGLARFDGYKFEKFTTKNGLPNNDIWHCAEDSEHRIWFLSYANAFFYFDLKDNKFHVIENPYKEYNDNHVSCYIQESKDSIRVNLGNTGKGYLSINLKNNKIYQIKRGNLNIYPIESEKVYHSISKNEAKEYYFNSVKGSDVFMARALSESFEHNLSHKPQILPNIKSIDIRYWSKVISIEFDDNKSIYGTNDSISFFKQNRFFSKPLNKLSDYKNDVLTLILSTGNQDKKLIVTEKDIFVINENLERVRIYDFIKNFNLNTVFFDKEGSLWLCTKNRGLYLLSQKSLTSKIYDDFKNQSITTISKDDDNQIWVGTNEGKLYYLNKKNRIIQQRLSLEPHIPIRQILAKDNFLSILWTGQMFTTIPQNKLCKKKTVYVKEKVLDRLSSYTFRNQFSGEYILTGKSIKSFDIIDKNHFAFGTAGDLNYLSIHPNKYEIKKRFSYTKIFSVKYINHETFAGTNKGLLKIDKYNKENYLESLKQKYPILTKPISCFADDAQKALWTGTNGYGVYRLLNDKAQQIPELSGMIINYLYSEKENKRIWVATNEGVFLLKLNLKTNQLTYAIQKISLAQGLPTLEVNCLVVRDNELFVGTSKGLAMLPIANILDADKNKTQMPLIIKNIKINRQDTTVTQYYDLNYRQNNIDIEFVALSYKSDKNIKYDYKMVSENADTLWHPVQDLHKEFSLLASGKYVFSLRAFDINGNPSQSIKPIIFVINPPFWDTAWFKILTALFIITAIILFFYLRTKNIQKKEEQKTQINKKFAELELQALQAQMNPHFVFNALSAIQNFILNNDAEEATDYLSRFSRLMRLFLESSRNKYISLSDEKVLLEYYIQLEQLRFKDKFTYQITLGDGVSLDTEIPSMLLQPFVENSINHGLVYKENNDGYLNIDFKRETDALICTIDDNGIGRKKAAEIKSKSLKSYKSRGTEITEERLRSLELIENTKIEISIIDKKDENQVAIGTKIVIVMYL
jgi:hypothetical protein